MKSYILGIACLVAAATNTLAQDAEEHHESMVEHHEHAEVYHDPGGSEIIIGHGFLPSEQMFDGSSRRLGYTTNQYTGAIFATYRYHISDVISLGMAFAYEYEQGTYTDNNYNNYYYNNGYYNPGNFVPVYNNNNYGSFTRSSFTIAPEITFSYGDFAHGHIRLYSVVGIGYTFRDERVTDAATNTEFNSPYIKRVHANAYASPIGVRAGGRLSGFFELGMGYKGVLNYGLTYRL